MPQGRYSCRIKVFAIPWLLVATFVAGCTPQPLTPTDSKMSPGFERSDVGVLMSPGALIEQEHLDRVERIRREARVMDVASPTVDQQLILPRHLFGTDRDLPVIRVAWGERAFFATDEDHILPDSGPILSMLANVLKADLPDTHLLVVGHTDARGLEEYNEDLSLRRAEHVSERLIDLGVRHEQIDFIGMGELQPIATNMNSEGMARNRRVEFFLGAYSDITLEAVSRVPFKPEDRELKPTPTERSRAPKYRDEGRSVKDEEKVKKVDEVSREVKVNVYSPKERAVLDNEKTRSAPSDLEDKTLTPQESDRGQVREAPRHVRETPRQVREAPRQVTIGGNERIIDAPAIVYREPAIGERRSGF